MVYTFGTIGGTATKLLWRVQWEVTMANIKKGVSISKLCRDTISDAVLNATFWSIKSLLIYFCHICSEDDPSQIW